jgi:Transglycosylase SLT domain
MGRLNFVGDTLKFAVFASPALIAGFFVVSGSVSAREHRSFEHRFVEHRLVHVHYARHFAGHHLMPIEANSGFSGFGSFGQSAPVDGTSGNMSGMASAQASTAGVPASLIQRVIMRESGGNPRAVHASNYGLMQIRLGTARAMGYTGSAAGLLDAQTNMTYAVRYLAGAYRAAGGNESRAVALYARGYYYQAKAQGFSPYASGATGLTRSSGL